MNRYTYFYILYYSYQYKMTSNYPYTQKSIGLHTQQHMKNSMKMSNRHHNH